MKADQNGAPVYMYLFTWQSPVMDDATDPTLHGNSIRILQRGNYGAGTRRRQEAWIWLKGEPGMDPFREQRQSQP